ncbi:MAG: zf-TFIIB domain-containing protein [Myxococcales bacterium]|nr:zf-TFIIB domain-containing protein [Myxococcales bacterium]
MESLAPRCSQPLRKTGIDWVFSCGRCGGIFAARIVGPLGQGVVAAATAASESAATRVATAAPVACPTCRRPTTRETFRGIDVDRCSAHGIWFDRDEILHVMKGERPGTLKGLGGVGAGLAAAAAASTDTSPTRARAASSIDLADVGLETALPVIEANVEAADAAAWMLVDMVAGLFDKE